MKDGMKHGTNTGYAQHYAAGERPCGACRAAKAEYDRHYRQDPAREQDRRLRSKAQYLAYRRMAAKYPDEVKRSGGKREPTRTLRAALRSNRPQEYAATYQEELRNLGL